jgi:HEAT repeat protein
MLLTLFLAAAIFASEAWAHGGVFRGPSGGVPPGLRDPFDAEPPPPPPSDPGEPGGPDTKPEDPSGGPITPREPRGGTGTGGESGPQPSPPQDGRRGAKTPVLTFESWRFWWGYNNDDILNLKSHLGKRTVLSTSPIYYAGANDENNVQPVQRATRAMAQRTIRPALLGSVNRPRDHEDIHGGALIALGKLGDPKDIGLFRDVLLGTHSHKGRRIAYGGQAKESAVLALGLLPDLGPAQKEAVRAILLDTITDEKMRTRERAWAAVSLGLQRDRGAVEALTNLLRPEHRYPDDNVPAGILCGLGLIGDPSVLPGLASALLEGDLFGRDVVNNDLLRSFAGYAIAKIGEPDGEVLKSLVKVMNSRSRGLRIKRSAAIAAGVLGAKADAESKREVVNALRGYVRKTSGDPSGVNFAIIALSQIGTDPAMRILLDLARHGRYGQRQFAGLGLATHLFYRRRAVEQKRGDPLDPDLANTIVKTLVECSEKNRDHDTRAAFMLCRGLVKDESAIEELVRIVAKRSVAPMLRGYCCVALGLIGDARAEVKEALYLALGERRDESLRRSAATGLALLHDAKVVDTLLRELERAHSFAVKGQLILAIGTIGDQSAVEKLVRMLEDKGQPSLTRAMAAVGLGMIGDTREIPALARLSKNYNYRASTTDLDELLFIF